MSAALTEIPQPTDPGSPRRRRFVGDAASVLVVYDRPDGERVTGVELIITNVPDGQGRGRDIYISSDDYYKKFVVAPARKTARGLEREPTAGYMILDKNAVLDRVRSCLAGLDADVVDFAVGRIKKYMY